MSKLALAAAFLAVLGGVAFWVVHSFLGQSTNTVILPDISTNTVVAAQPGAPMAVPGSGIGGVVQNEQGRPIPNVNVQINWSVSSDPNNPAAVNNRTFKNVRVRTDSKGHWSYGGVPAFSLPQVAITLNQRDYAQTNIATPSVQQMLDQTAVFVMSRGTDIHGVVVNPAGQPVAGAQVVLHRDYNNVGRPIKTDGEGKFSLRHVVVGGQTLVLVTANGYAPSAQTLDSAPTQPLRLVLGAGRTVSGRVTDKSGKPIEGVTVAINRWHQIYQPDDNRVTTDAQGKYELPHAPKEECQVEAYMQGFNGDSEQISATQEKINFTLSAEVTVHGTVTDAQTGQPISTFTLITGAQWTGNPSPNFQTFNAHVYHGGKYSQALNGYAGSIEAMYVRIQAKGYLPADSPPIQTSQEVDLQLKRGKDLVGRVFTADGKPAAEVTVALALPAQWMSVSNGAIQGQDAPQAVTDAQGRFDLPPQPGRFLLVAVSPDGYAKVDQDELAKSPDVHLQRYGRVQGRLFIGAKPAAGIRVSVQPQQIFTHFTREQPMVNFNMSQLTDSGGNFIFDAVPAGSATVSRIIEVSMGDGGTMWNSTQTQSVDVVGGSTITLTLGGKGRPVIGRIIVPKEYADTSNWMMNNNVYGEPALPPPPPEMPDSIKNGSTVAQRVWMAVFYMTPTGRAYQAKHRITFVSQGYSMEIAADHTFRIDDVLPGRYSVNINFWLRRPVAGQPPQNAFAQAQFTMPPIPGGQSDEPLKIPDIVIKPWANR